MFEAALEKYKKVPVEKVLENPKANNLLVFLNYILLLRSEIDDEYIKKDLQTIFVRYEELLEKELNLR